jgi:histidine triad (HIT) family protein
MANGCIFCRIVRGEAPSWKVYEDDRVVVILDIYPVQKGHLLVVTKRHYESVHDAEPCDVAYAFAVSGALARYYRENLKAPGVNIITNSGRPSGQEIFHFHIHVIPRWTGGGWRRLGERHPLTSEEANEVLNMLDGSQELIRKYAERVRSGCS